MGLQYLKNVATLEFDGELCRGCGTCTEVCPHEVFIMKENKAAIRDRDDCMECGACARNCPFEAIRVKAGVGCAAAMLKNILTRQEPGAECT
jgi:NAD-dependent dihydropyrimidine dehydrogenase PreA subunit